MIGLNTTWWQLWDLCETDASRRSPRNQLHMATPATVTLQPPDQFDFSRPDGWLRWIKRFERYCVASGLADKAAVVQVSTLVYTMGTEAEDVLTSFGLSDADGMDYAIVKE